MRRVNPELRVNCFLAPTHAVKEDGQAAITDFEISGKYPTKYNKI